MVVIIASDAHGRLHEDDEFIIDIYTRYIYIQVHYYYYYWPM